MIGEAVFPGCFLALKSGFAMAKAIEYKQELVKGRSDWTISKAAAGGGATTCTHRRTRSA
jgi:hypothetical protein